MSSYLAKRFTTTQLGFAVRRESLRSLLVIFIDRRFRSTRKSFGFKPSGIFRIKRKNKLQFAAYCWNIFSFFFIQDEEKQTFISRLGYTYNHWPRTSILTFVKRDGGRFYVMTVMMMVMMVMRLLVLLLAVTRGVDGVIPVRRRLLLLLLLLLLRLVLIRLVLGVMTPSTSRRGEVHRFRVDRVSAGRLLFGSRVRFVCCNETM